MKIYNSSSEILRSDQTRELQRGSLNREKQNATQPSSPVQRGDKVQISDAGRALAAQAADGTRGELTPERIAEVVLRVGGVASTHKIRHMARDGRPRSSSDVVGDEQPPRPAPEGLAQAPPHRPRA